MSDEETLGLRERKKLETRNALSDAALELMLERGIDDVVREDIAARAGVSVRTFNNYFSSKYDALAYRPATRIRRMIEVLRTRPTAEPMWDAIAAAALEPFESLNIGRVPTRQQLVEIRKLVAVPEVRNAISRELADDVLLAIAARSGTDPQRDLYPRLITNILIGGYQAVVDTYVRADPPRSVTEIMREAFALIASGIPAPPR